MKETRLYSYDDLAGLKPILVGRKVVSTSYTEGELVLDNGVVLRIDKENSSCCSGIDLTGLFTTDHIITDVVVEDNEDSTNGEGEYKAWIKVLTEAGPIHIATADGDASNGYYLHGFALNVTVLTPEI